MARYTLYIGTRNISSWSLRPWLAMKMAGVDFEEIEIPLRQADTSSSIRKHSPSGKVPLLKIQQGGDTELVWDSLAICETIAERFPAAGLWPNDAAQRAEARSISAEMHSGFADLRAALPMEILTRKKHGPLSDAVRDQIARILEIWRLALTRSSGNDGFLFGRFSIADAFYAPVVTRFQSHGVEIPALQQAYADRILSLGPIREWASKAQPAP
jgi:glutathione S-transferase